MPGFNDIPQSLIDAARIDGAKGWDVFARIQVPLLRPVIQLVLVLATIGTIQVFDIVFVLTEGGPGTSTYTVMWYIYQNVFQGGAVGYAAAMGVLMLVTSMILAVLYMRGTGMGAVE
jgi:ABC-type sugar transport system permease subunit